MARYSYFLAVPINPAKLDKIFEDRHVDEERIDALIDYIVPIVRDMWEKTKRLPIIQTELSQSSQSRKTSNERIKLS